MELFNFCATSMYVPMQSIYVAFLFIEVDVHKDENIGNYGYIGISILRIYQRYIDGYFEKKNIIRSIINILKLLY